MKEGLRLPLDSHPDFCSLFNLSMLGPHLSTASKFVCSEGRGFVCREAR